MTTLLSREEALKMSDFFWEETGLPALRATVPIKALSPKFDPNWATTGEIDRMVEFLKTWVDDQYYPRLTAEIIRIPGLTPLLYVDIAGDAPGTVVFYGHGDRQPEFKGWRPGLDPWKAVDERDRLYGRGTADDGYALFAAMGALTILNTQYWSLPRCIILIEMSEESGSPHLTAHLEALKERIGKPDMVACLDAGCGDYKRAWVATSLRGTISFKLGVRVLAQGVHSGEAGGIVPDSMRIMRALLNRLEDAETGRIHLSSANVVIPSDRLRESYAAGNLLGAEALHKLFPLAGATRLMKDEPDLLLVSNAWEPSLTVIGIEDGVPEKDRQSPGNTLRSETIFHCSLRIPPTADPEAVIRELRALLTAPGQIPYNADVTLTINGGYAGWNSKPHASWLEQAIHHGSQAFFGNPPGLMGVGGSIPFVEIFRRMFPDAESIITGILGPESNAHGPNEFAHKPMLKMLTAWLAEILAAFVAR